MNIKRSISTAAAVLLALLAASAAFAEGVDTTVESAMLEATNAARAAAGKDALILSTALTEAARIRAKESATLFDHTRPAPNEGDQPFTAIVGWEENKVAWGAVGENLAKGAPTPQKVVEGWMASAGHRKNILGEEHPFTHIGLGCYVDGDGTRYWAQLFSVSVPSDDPPLAPDDGFVDDGGSGGEEDTIKRGATAAGSGCSAVACPIAILAAAAIMRRRS